MNKLLSLVFILFSALGFGQALKGTALDKTTGKPLDRATVSTQDGHRTTVTNSEGKFAISFPDGTKNVIIKHLGYTSLSINPAGAAADGIYYLEPKAYSLEEVVVTNTPVYEVVERIRANSVKHLQSPIVLNTYYREFITINDTCRKFSDALIDYSLSKNKKATKISTEIAVKQSRAAQVNANVKEGFLRGIGPDTRDMMEYACNFDFIEEYFPNKKAYKKYNFSFEERADGNGNALTAIVFHPKEDVHEYLYEGEIVYDQETELILNADVHPAASHTQYLNSRNMLIARYTISDLVVKTTFTEINGTYMPAYLYIYGMVHTWNKNYDNAYKFTSDVIVTGSTADISIFNGKYRHRSLYEAGNNYTEAFWLNSNAMVLTPKEEAIIESLEKNNTIQQQTKP